MTVDYNRLAVKRCGFDEAYIGRCNQQWPCEKHDNLKCIVCQEHATHSCDVASSLVCGYPLCDNCRHNYPGEGERSFFTGTSGHRKI